MLDQPEQRGGDPPLHESKISIELDKYAIFPLKDLQPAFTNVTGQWKKRAVPSKYTDKEAHLGGHRPQLHQIYADEPFLQTQGISRHLSNSK